LGGNAFERSFFYLPLVDGEANRSQSGSGENGFVPECIDYVLTTFGERRFLAEVDTGRDFRESGGIIGAILNFTAGDGFSEFSERHNSPYRTAREYRERYILEALRGAS
jgi:hypothetical protein